LRRGNVGPTCRHPIRDAPIMSFGASLKLNIHWNSVSPYIARFHNEISTQNLSVGIRYSFHSFRTTEPQLLDDPRWSHWIARIQYNRHA
jgi:hypothetical protein